MKIMQHFLYLLFPDFISGAELIDHAGELALKIRSLVLRNHMLAGDTVKKRTYTLVLGLGLSLIGYFTKIADSVACCLGIIAIAQTTYFRLANSFQR